MPTTIHLFAIEEPTNKGYPVFSNNHILSHHIPQRDMDIALEQAKNRLWEYRPVPGAALGKILYSFLDGSNGTLSGIFTRAVTGGSEIKLFLTLPLSLMVLPFELIHNVREFLLLSNNPKVHLMYTVTEHNKYADHQPVKRSLKILFILNCFEFVIFYHCVSVLNSL